MKYIRRLRKQIVWWKTVRSAYGWKAMFDKDVEVIYMPRVHEILGTVFERPFYVWRNSSNPCSCSMCRDAKYKRNRSGRNGYRFEIEKQLEDEGRSDRVARIH